MESLIPFTLFGSGIVFGIVLCVLLVTMFLSDLYETGGYAFVAVCLFLGFNYFWGNFPVFDYVTWYNVSIYLFIGFVFSLVRTYFKGRELKAKITMINDVVKSDPRKHFDLKYHVFRWWFLFPFAALNWLFGHLLKDLFNFIYHKIENVYITIFNA